jgi:hypothetical protein
MTQRSLPCRESAVYIVDTLGETLREQVFFPCLQIRAHALSRRSILRTDRQYIHFRIGPPSHDFTGESIRRKNAGFQRNKVANNTLLIRAGLKTILVFCEAE